MDWFLTWIWQGVALALVVSFALDRQPAFSAATRYVIWWATLSGVLVMPWLPGLGDAGASTTPAEVAVAGGATAGSSRGVLQIPAPAEWLIAIAIGAWLGCVMLSLVRVALAAWRVGELKSRCRDLPPALEAQLQLSLRVRMRRRPAAIGASDDLDMPALLGLGRPVISVPRHLFRRLAADELDQVVLHELGHAQRWDDWSSFLQRIVEAFWCFHPAVWLIGRALNLEREVACDDRVIAESGRRRRYAACLTKVAEACTWNNSSVLAPTAIGCRPQISKRIERLLDGGRNVSVRPSMSAVAGGSGVLASMLVVCTMVPPMLSIELESSMTNGVVFDRPIADRPSLLADPPSAAVSPSAESASPGAGPASTAQSTRSPAPAPTRSAAASQGSDTRVEAGAHEIGTAPVADFLSAISDNWQEPVAMIRRVEPLRAEAPLAAVAVRHSGAMIAGIPPVGLRVLRSKGTDGEGAPRATGDPAPWDFVATAGVAVGTGAKHAGIATGKFFSRLGASIGKSF